MEKAVVWITQELWPMFLMMEAVYLVLVSQCNNNFMLGPDDWMNEHYYLYDNAFTHDH